MNNELIQINGLNKTITIKNFDIIKKGYYYDKEFF